MSKDITLPVIAPFPYQLPFWNAMDRGYKKAILAWHRRAGKDLVCFSYMVREAMKRVGAYMYYFPTLADADQALWKNVITIGTFSGFLVDFLCPAELVLKKNENDYIIYLINGSVIRIRGTDNLKVVGANCYGYVFSEWSLQKKEAFELVAPILRENGGWVIFNGTMREKTNHLWKDVQKLKDSEDYFVSYLKPDFTKAYYWVSPDDELDKFKQNINPELEGLISPYNGQPFYNVQRAVDNVEMSYEMACREYINDPQSVTLGTYFRRNMLTLAKDGGIGDFSWNDTIPVYTFWDLGGSGEEADPTAIVFAQKHENIWHIIDYYENTGMMFEEYAKVLHSKPYSYAGHYAPHDAKKHMMFGDLITYAKKYGVEFRRILKTNSVIDDIEVMRSNWNRLRFNAKKVDALLAHIDNYREGAGGKAVKNGSQHGADALRSLIMSDVTGIVTPYLGIVETAYEKHFYKDNGDYEDNSSPYLF